MFMRKSSLMQKSGEFFAFACSAKILVIGFVFFSFFPFSSLFLDGLPQVFWRTFYHSSPMKRMTKVRLISLDAVKNVPVGVH